MFKSLSNEKDFLPVTERRKSIRKSLNLSASVLENKFVVFIRGTERRNLNLAVYQKQGILLQFLREEFSDPRLSYFVDPKTRKEVDYNTLWDLDTVLVLEDADNMNAMIYAYEKGDSTFCITNQKNANSNQ